MLDLNEELQLITNKLKKENEEIEQQYKKVREEQKQELIKKILEIREELINKIGCLEDLGLNWFKLSLNEMENPFGCYARYFYINKKENWTYTYRHFGVEFNSYGDEIDEENLNKKSYEYAKKTYDFVNGTLKTKVNNFVINFIEDYKKETERKRKVVEEREEQ